jgi:hypothetical protein
LGHLALRLIVSTSFLSLLAVPIPLSPSHTIVSPPLLALRSHAKVIQQGQAQTHKSHPCSEGCPSSRSDFRRLFRGPPFFALLIFSNSLIHNLYILSRQQEFQAPQPHHPHFQGLQPLHHLRLIPPSLDAHHPTPPPEEDNWQLLPSDPTSNSDSAKLLPLTSSRSSSLASLPPGASPPLPNPVIPTRNPPPFAGTPPLRSPHNKDTREREKDRRSAPTAVSILNALNPQFSPPPPPNLDVPRPVRDDDTVVYAPSEGSIREEKKERGGFWSWATTGDREGHRREARDKDDGQQDLMRMIGMCTALPSCPSLFLILST